MCQNSQGSWESQSRCFTNGVKSTTKLNEVVRRSQFGEGSFPGNGNLKLTAEQEKIHELEKKLKDAELERDILKKAIGIFSKSGR